MHSALLPAALLGCLAAAATAQPVQVQDNLPADLFRAVPPPGLPQTVPSPAENPLTESKFELGRRLFFDPVLSADGTVSCASCHEPAHAFASRIARPFGIGGHRSLHDAPTLFNRAFGKTQRWDGSAESIEDQALRPIEDPNEMGSSVPEAVARVAAREDYATLFMAAFDAPASRETLAQALGSFVRGLFLGDSPVDRFQGGEPQALTAAEKNGLWVYESKGRCWRCHSGANFSDEGFHNTGVAWRDGELAAGRFAVTGDERDRGAFKTPTLRGLAQTAPYMHDGSIATLEEVVEFYAQGGRANPGLDPRVEPLQLSEQEKRNLVAFLRALSRSQTP